MMKMRLLKTARIKELLNQVPENLDLYRNGDFDFLKIDRSYFIETSHEIDENKLSMMTSGKKDHKEVENCSMIYEALGALTHYLARDERLWIYLVHTDLLNYSRQRWPIPDDDEKAAKHIREHFFVIGARGFERNNAAARLWWMASLCSRVNGLALEVALTCLLHQYDVRANIIERPTTSQSANVFSAILKKLRESYKGDKSLFERDKFRWVMRELNLRGGVKLLGALSEEDVQEILDECVLTSAS